MSALYNKRGERLKAIESLLFRNGQGLRAVELAQHCCVDRRTIYRDLAILEHLGVPVYQDDGRFFLNRDYYLTSIRMSFLEAVALFTAARAFGRVTDQQNPYIISALNKLASALPEPIAGHVEQLVDWMRSYPVDRNYVQTLETVIRAWIERRQIRLWASQSRTGDVLLYEMATYFIEPLATGGLYVVGLDDLTQAVQAVKLESVKRAKITEIAYDIPADFDPRPYLQSAWGLPTGDPQNATRVVLAFSPEVTPLIRERLWHSSQQIATLADKRCTLSLHVHDWHQLLPWLRSWGAQIEVLEPTSLRSELTAEAMRTLRLYGASAST